MPAALKDSQVSLRLPNELKAKMETYAALTGRSKSYVALQALDEYLAWRIPQIEDLREAVREADDGQFATDEEVSAVMNRYAAAGVAGKSTRRAAAPRRK